MTTRETWIRVKSEKELRAGSYRLRPCNWCGRVEVFVLAKSLLPDAGGVCRYPDGSVVPASQTGWLTIGKCNSHPASASVFDRAIADGRLYRLSDALDSTDETTTAPRERELTNAKG